MSSTDLHRPITHTELVVNSLRRWPSREAFKADDRSYTYAQAGDMLARFARVLKERGLGRGQGVGVLSPNRPEAWFSQIGAGIAGGRYTALHPMGSLSDHEYACSEAELKILCVDPADAERAGALLEACPCVEAVLTFGPAEVGEDVVMLAEGVGAVSLEPGPQDPDDIAWLLYTGGTTGVPKAAELTEHAIAQMALAVS